MEYLIGLALGLAVAIFAMVVGLDRGRSFYATVLIVVASYYVLFAAMGASGRTIVAEIGVGCGFLVLAVIGFKKHLWLVATAIIGHGVFDFFHHFLIDNPRMPHWWPGFCMAFDVSAGAWFAARLILRKAPVVD